MTDQNDKPKISRRTLLATTAAGGATAALVAQGGGKLVSPTTPAHAEGAKYLL